VGGPESRTVDDEGLPRPPAGQGKLPRSLLRLLVRGESLMFTAIAVALVIAVAVFVSGVHDLVLAPRGEQFAVTITRAVNSALFIVVILELTRTIVARRRFFLPNGPDATHRQKWIARPEEAEAP
jgi:hypothetical protein